MSGHNKWSKIKHKKAAEDAKKSKAFSKFTRLITLEAKKAAGNKDAPGLRTIIERARAINMPADNIERAIKKGSDKESANLEEVTYEAYGPGGSALIVEGLTDNKNRTLGELKILFADYDTTLAERGAALWAFEKTPDKKWHPKTTMSLSDENKEKLKQLIDMLEENDDVQAVYTNGG
ncbi:MAG: YebC/PmpR family DNA-binding transcriptional regulator [Parcubacteria group bacterium]|nr:YebC/PmpR family DNA-binding transcriptional regulator [Parcubacteria group bacterium]